MRDIAGEAEQVILKLQKNKFGEIALTTSQIRRFLTAVNSVTNKVSYYKMKNFGQDKLSDELAAEVKYLKVKLAYQVGREKKNNKTGPIEDFSKNAHLIEEIDSIGNSIARYEEFAKYFEALVAYHKFYGGKDK